MENNENNIAGYCFKDEELYNRAKKEIKSLEQIDASLKGKKTEEILEIYKDVNEKELFKTPIGIEYLKMVRNRLKKSPMIKNDDIPPVYVSKIEVIKTVKKDEDDGFKYKASITINVFLVIVIIVMFAISRNNTPTKQMERYKEELENHYASWEQSLTEREKNLGEKK